MKNLRRANHRLVVIAFGMLVIGALHAGSPPDKGLRFNSPGVLDLAERSQTISGNTIPAISLAPADAEAILAAPVLDEVATSLRFSDEVYGCKPPSKICSQQHEHKLIETAGNSIKRDGKRLTITSAGVTAAFIDWMVPTTKTADGDEETHWYLGRLEGSGYQRVEVQFGHDAPGDFLINPQSGKVAFVHNCADIAALAPDGGRLITFNTLDSPLSIRVAALDATGPRLELQCVAGRDGVLATAQFKGWHDARSFDLAIEIRAARSKLMQKLAVRLTDTDAGWSMASNGVERLQATGFACQTASPSAPGTSRSD